MILNSLQFHLYTRHKQIKRYIPFSKWQNMNEKNNNIYSSNFIDSNQIICTFITTYNQETGKKNVVPNTEHGAIPLRIGSVSGIAGCGDSSLIYPVPDVETLPCKKTESGNCQQSRVFFGILSLEKAFEPGFWSEITITDLLKAKMAAHW